VPGLRTLGVAYDFASTGVEFETLYLGTSHSNRTYDAFITDTYGIPAVESYVRKEKCKFRIVDYWGTPPHQNGPKFDLLQYWTPFHFQGSPNHQLGYMIHRSEPGVRKKWQGLIWGKEPRYFDFKWDLIQRVAAFIPLILTSKKLPPEVIPKNVTNMGIVTSQVRSQLLAESLFIIGLGDPVLGKRSQKSLKSLTKKFSSEGWYRKGRRSFLKKSKKSTSFYRVREKSTSLHRLRIHCAWQTF
jgi:hypothetical protein